MMAVIPGCWPDIQARLTMPRSPRRSASSAADLPSKTQVKKAAQELQDLGLAILEMPSARLAGIALDDRLRQALADVERITAPGARKRHMKFVGKLLRDTDTTELRQALADLHARQAHGADQLHLVEHWRDRLLTEDLALSDWIAQHPQSDTRQFRNLIKSAREERDAAEAAARRGEAQRKGRYYRDLFRQLRAQLLGSTDLPPLG